MPARHIAQEGVRKRAEELQKILHQVIPDLIKFVERADVERASHQAQSSTVDISLVQWPQPPSFALEDKIQDLLSISAKGVEIEELGRIVNSILTGSVNTSSPGFLDKLTAAPLPPGIVAECVLGVLNANLHIYKVSPVLTLIEKRVTKDLATMFGLCGPRSGGISVQGGSAGNLTSIVIARNTLFPHTKTVGNIAAGGQLVLFASAHGHYSIEKAAQALGFGSNAVIQVPVDRDGRMDCESLKTLIRKAVSEGKVPFYVCATAGTTVLGSFDPFERIAMIARKHRLWFHIDAAWGGGFIFAGRQELQDRLQGTGLADSIATNPQKMLGVPITCSFLLGRDMSQFEQANTLKAGYLFHDEDPLSWSDCAFWASGQEFTEDQRVQEWKEPCDIADMTLQCGRRGDSLKFFLCWKYYGTQGYQNMVDNAHAVAVHLYEWVSKHQDLTLVLDNGPPSCLQVCFYYTPAGRFVHEINQRAGCNGNVPHADHASLMSGSCFEYEKTRVGALNTRVTARIANALIGKGFMVDYAPALERQTEKGSFFRVVVNISTIRETVSKLVKVLVQTGESILKNS